LEIITLQLNCLKISFLYLSSRAVHDARFLSQVFMLQYQTSGNPNSREIQRIWNNCVAEPPDDVPLNQMENQNGQKTPIDRLMVSYHRSRNLGGNLSYRKIDGRAGSKVSTFLKK